MVERSSGTAPQRSSAAQAGKSRLNIRLDPDTRERISYWARRHDVSANEYMVEAVLEKIARENGDYDLPTLEMARLAQLVDEQRSQTTAVSNLARIVESMASSMTLVMAGNSYLADREEDGELFGPDTQVQAP